MIRVLYIARYHSPTMERKIALLAAQPDLLVSLVRPTIWKDGYGRVAIETIAQDDYHVVPVPMVGRADNPHRTLYRTIDFSMREARPDIIHAEEEPDSLAALQIVLARRLCARRAKLVLHTWQNVDRPKSALVRWVVRMTLRGADAVLGANREALAVLARLGYRGRTGVIPPMGVDTGVFRPQGGAVTSEGICLVYAGRFVPEKGLDTLIQAMAMTDTCVSLRLIGDGPAKSSLVDQVRSLDLAERVDFLPPMSPSELASAMDDSYALVLPSRTTAVWQEQFGRVLVESMACGTPVIGSDSGAIPEVVGDAGLIFPEGDASALARCVGRLIASPALRADLVERGLMRVADLYSQERVAAQTSDFYRQMVP